jgi:ABC-type multidrug transport system permease subunit
MADRQAHPLVELTLARLREFLREPEALFWVFAFPLLMALALGIAFRSERTQEVVVGLARGSGDAAAESETLQRLRQTSGVRVREVPAEGVEPALRNGDVMLVVVPGVPPTYRFDPTRPESRVARLVVDNALQRAAGRADVWSARDEKVETPGSRYIDWLLPGLLGMNIMGTGLWSIGFSVVQARSRKLLKRLMATPMPRGAYLLSHFLARLLFLVLEVGLLLLFGWLVFGVRTAGSLALVGALSLLGAFSFSGIGLLIASRARTIEAVSGLMNVAMLPMWLLSGVFFASSNFPDVAQPFIRALPLTALNDALRAVMLEGRGLAGVAIETTILSVWGLGSFLLALKLFRWR